MIGKGSDMRAIIIVGAVLGSLTAAHAADMAVKGPMPAPVSNWTGMYIGGFAGGSWANATAATFAVPTTFHDSGFIGGVYLGYNYELPDRFVIGARISVPLGAINNTNAFTLGAPGTTGKESFQWAAAANLIFGYDMGLWMPYIGLGAIYAENKLTVNIPGVGTNSNTELHPGVNVLAGVKYALSQSWAVGVQFNHSQFASATYSMGPPTFATPVVSFNQNSVVGTIDYRF
jgi:outer membrane immunogenic protein